MFAIQRIQRLRTYLFLLLLVMLTSAHGEVIYTGFQGNFAPANWTTKYFGTGSSLDIGTAQGSIRLHVVENGLTQLYIPVQQSTTFTFDWNYISTSPATFSFDLQSSSWPAPQNQQTQYYFNGPRPNYSGKRHDSQWSQFLC